MVDGRIHRADPRPQRSCPRSQTHPALHRPGRDRRRTCLTRHLRATDRHVWHASPASSPTALPAVSQRSRRVHLPRIRRRCGRARAKLSPNLVDRQTAAMDAWHRDGACDRLRELCVPTLVATGSEDIVIPAPNALALVNAIPGAWLAQFKGGGHAFMAQYPRQLADLINEFLALCEIGDLNHNCTKNPRTT